MNRDELLRRFPEINKINDLTLRDTVADAFLEHCPDYFWEVPASTSGKYHPKDQSGQHGLWLHTKRAFTCFERISRSAVESGEISEQEADYGRASILLHDLFKQGHEPRDEEHTSSDHDVIASTFLGKKTDLPDPVIECIESHNGPWGQGKDPESKIEKLHHYADMIASDRNAHFDLIGKVPHELEEVRQDGF
jgi:hypothetical protein